MQIYHAMLMTMTGEPPFMGNVTVENGRITAVHAGECSPEPGDIDAMGGLLLPGFVDTHTHLGIIEDGMDFEGDDCNEATDPFMPHLRAIDAVNPFDVCFSEARTRGVTTVLVSPGSANPCGGTILAMKTAGTIADEMAIAEVGMKFALGENPKVVYDHRDETPVTRMATAAILREGLRKAKRYQEDLDAAQSDRELTPPEPDLKSEALLPLLRGEQLAFFHCHRADDIATALRIAAEFSCRPVLIHATEGYRIAETLAKQNVPAIVGPLIGARCKPELRGQTIANAARLKTAGVPIAICTDHPEVPIEYLPASAAIAKKGGLSEEDALASLTSAAADIVGIGHRVGRIQAGLDADLQLYAPDSNPLSLEAEPIWVMIDGKLVSGNAAADHLAAIRNGGNFSNE